MSSYLKDRLAQDLSLALAALFLLLLVVLPLVVAVRAISVPDGPYGSGTSYSEGVLSAIQDPRNIGSVVRSLQFATVTSVIQFCMSLVLSRLLFTARHSWVLPICLVPIALPPIATSMMWKALLDYESGGLNVVFKAASIPPKPWLSTAQVFPSLVPGLSPNWAQVSVFLTDTWIWLPFLVGAELIAFSRVPRQLVEAAALEGASENAIFWRLVCPISSSYLFILVFIRFLDSYRTFDTVWAFFGRLPAVEHFSARAYSLGYYDRDYISALTLVGLGVLVISPISALLLTFVRRVLVGTAEVPDAAVN